MLAYASLQMAAGAAAASGGGGGSGPPSAPPSAVYLSSYGGSMIRVSWLNGDSTASTQVGQSLDTSEPDAEHGTAAPGASSYETGVPGTIATDDGSGSYWWCRHIKNGSVTAWVRCAQMVETP